MGGAHARDILVAEDDLRIAKLLRLTLEAEGYRVTVAGDGASVPEVFHRVKPDFVILDLGLPNVDGFQICGRLRAESDVPILILTSRPDEVDKVVGLSLGADDYMVKPFSPRELVARVKAITRRTARRDAGSGAEAAVLRHRDIEVDATRHRVMVDGGPVNLTAAEFTLLKALVEFPDRVFTRDDLLNRLYPGYESASGDRTIDVHVARLRQKLGDNPAAPRYIATVRGIGYKLL